MKRPDLLTAAQAAERLGVSHRRVLQYCQRGQLPAVLLGNAYLIPAAAVAAFRPLPPGRPKRRAADGS